MLVVMVNRVFNERQTADGGVSQRHGISRVVAHPLDDFRPPVGKFMCSMITSRAT